MSKLPDWVEVGIPVKWGAHSAVIDSIDSSRSMFTLKFHTPDDMKGKTMDGYNCRHIHRKLGGATYGYILRADDE